jgi:RNA polymerase primary sigma factor
MKNISKPNCRNRNGRLTEPALRRIAPRLPRSSRVYSAPATVTLKPVKTSAPLAISEPARTEPAQTSYSSGYARSDTLQLYLREIGQVKLLTPAEEIALAKRIKRGDEKAREQMIKANLRLVVKIARDYEGQGLPLLDLINEGNIGLMKGVERFDPNKGAKLSTYGSLWIKQSIRRALSNQSKTIRLPDHVVDKVSHIRKAEMKLRELFDRDPTDEEIADHLGLAVKRVKIYRDAARAPVSLDAPLGNDGSDSDRVSEIVADPNAAAPFERLARETDAELVREMFAALTDREKAILAMRFGLNDDTQKTLEEIGKHFGVTRERIRQIEAEALLKLRAKIQKREAMAEASSTN